MKPFLFFIVVILLLSSPLTADEDIHGLGMVEVTEVMYVQGGEFSVTLSMSLTTATETNLLFFNNEPTLSFQFHPDNLDGICVIVTPDQMISRRDVVLTGPSFVNLLLSKMVSGDALNLSCGFIRIPRSSEVEPGKYVLSYFQVNCINE